MPAGRSTASSIRSSTIAPSRTVGPMSSYPASTSERRNPSNAGRSRYLTTTSATLLLDAERRRPPGPVGSNSGQSGQVGQLVRDPGPGRPSQDAHDVVTRQDPDRTTV